MSFSGCPATISWCEICLAYIISLRLNLQDVYARYWQATRARPTILSPRRAKLVEQALRLPSDDLKPREKLPRPAE